MLASSYRLVRLLGRGGMAEVYEANDGALGRRVAVKVFRGETDIETSQARQQLEIQALARVQHHNIVAVFDAGTDGGVSFLVMQLIDGVTLAERTRASALAPAETARVGRAVADALADNVRADGPRPPALESQPVPGPQGTQQSRRTRSAALGSALSDVFDHLWKSFGSILGEIKPAHCLGEP